MTTRGSLIPSKMTAVVLIAVACALAGCGRKAGLDRPPGGSDYQGEPGAASDSGPPASQSAASAQRDVFDPTATTSSEKSIIAPRGPKKRIILDPILD